MSRMAARNPTPGEVEVAADVASKAFPYLTYEHWQESFQFRITLSLSDPVFERGWEFGVEAAEGRVALCKPDRSNVLEMDVQTLVKLYSGYLSPFDAWTMGKLRCRDLRPVVLACQVFPSLKPFRSWLEPG